MKFDFYTEEQWVLNHLAQDQDREMCLHKIRFAIMASPEEEAKEYLETTYEKVAAMTDEEFKDLKEYLPFDVMLDEEQFEESFILSQDETEPVPSIPRQPFLSGYPESIPQNC